MVSVLHTWLISFDPHYLQGHDRPSRLTVCNDAASQYDKRGFARLFRAVSFVWLDSSRHVLFGRSATIRKHSGTDESDSESARYVSLDLV